jgi:hypothetical protein
MRYILALSAFLIATPAFAACDADALVARIKQANPEMSSEVLAGVFIKFWTTFCSTQSIPGVYQAPAPAGITSCSWVYGNWVCQNY